MSDLISGAVHWYEKGGLSTLLRGATVYAVGSTVTKLTTDGYSNLLAEAKETIELGNRYWTLTDECGQVSDDIYEELRSFAEAENKTFKCVPQYEFRTPFFLEATDATVFGPHATAITEDTVYGDAIRTDINKTRWMLNQAITASPRRLRSTLSTSSRPAGTEQIETGCILYHHAGNFYHWIIEQVPKIRAVEQYETNTGNDVTLIVPVDGPSFVFEFLELCGYDNEQYHTWEGEPLRINKLLVPSLPEPTPGVLDWLRAASTDATNQAGADIDWIYISRQNSSRGRKVENFEEIRPLLEEHDVKILQPEELALSEQMSYFCQASGVIAPHGAGLTNVIWGTDLKVVELFNDVVKPYYFVLSTIQGHDYIPVAGDKTGDQKRLINKDIYIDIEKIRRILE